MRRYSSRKNIGIAVLLLFALQALIAATLFLHLPYLEIAGLAEFAILDEAYYFPNRIAEFVAMHRLTKGMTREQALQIIGPRRSDWDDDGEANGRSLKRAYWTFETICAGNFAELTVRLRRDGTVDTWDSTDRFSGC